MYQAFFMQYIFFFFPIAVMKGIHRTLNQKTKKAPGAEFKAKVCFMYNFLSFMYVKSIMIFTIF